MYSTSSFSLCVWTDCAQRALRGMLGRPWSAPTAAVSRVWGTRFGGGHHLSFVRRLKVGGAAVVIHQRRCVLDVLFQDGDVHFVRVEVGMLRVGKVAPEPFPLATFDLIFDPFPYRGGVIVSSSHGAAWHQVQPGSGAELGWESES